MSSKEASVTILDRGEALLLSGINPEALTQLRAKHGHHIGDITRNPDGTVHLALRESRMALEVLGTAQRIMEGVA